MPLHTRRTTADLVTELRAVATDTHRAALVVGFDDRTEFVWANDPDALHVLNAHIRNGGDPLGLVIGSDDGEGAASIPGVTLHTPRDPELSGGISCFEVRGLEPEQVAERLSEKRIRTNPSPYKISYARVAAGIMNFPEEIDTVLREIRGLAGARAT